MFISPLTAIANNWITGDITEKNIQPNAIDFTLDKLYSISDEPFYISEKSKTMRGGVEQTPTFFSLKDEEFWTLKAGGVYDGMSNFYVNVPKGVACMFIVRSTFNRNGIFITNGLYDTGFKGHLGFAIHNRSALAYIAPGTRIGQIMFIESGSVGQYKGQYNTEKGEHWTDGKKD